MSRPLPTIILIATGGTIAGVSGSPTDPEYTAGAIPAATLLAGIPALGEVADLQVEQLFNLDSKDMTPAHWLMLARRVRAALAQEDVAGVVVTHGTDTLEETAYFLLLALDSDKPVVLTGAMRPATALSADGPRNLYDALTVAASPASRGHGVLAVMGGEIFAASGLRKAHTCRLAAFCSGVGGPGGEAAPLRFFRPPGGRPQAILDLDSTETLPQVDLLYVAAGTTPVLLEAAVRAGARGVVLVLPGNGSLPASWMEPVGRLTSSGIPVLRASRVGAGAVTRRDEDAICGTLPAGGLPPPQARVALMVALAGGKLALLPDLLNPT